MCYNGTVKYLITFMRQQKKFVSFWRLFVWVLLFGIVGIFSVGRAQAEEGALSEEALADLVKPSVVRIAEHVIGTARIPAVTVDVRRHLVAVVPDKFTEVPVDEYYSGSGFVIHPDGYIATSAHVVSLETIKLSLASESALSAIYENAMLLTDAEMQNFLGDDTSSSFGRQVVRYVIDHSDFKLTNQIAVLRPNSQTTKIGDLITEGFPAEITAVNDRFEDDERDVALLKIAESGLPSLRLGSAEGLAVGKKVFIFGFPTTAEVNNNNQAEATFTQGVVSALKESASKNLQVFQTDAKVSQGSSGGPLFNERGEVMGIITFQTNELTRTAGDNFAFALPIDLVTTQALANRILPTEGVYGMDFRQGFAALLEKRCDTALVSFRAVSQMNQNFLSEKFVAPYIRRCEALKQAGESLDTSWDKVRGGVKTLGNPFLYIVGGSFTLFGLFGVVILWLLRQVRREEAEIVNLENRLEADEAVFHHGIETELLPKDTSVKKKII